MGEGLAQGDSETMKYNKSGVYIVAYGKRARDCAAELMRTVHKRNAGLPICLVSDKALGEEDVLVELPQVEPRARTQKIRIYEYAPAEWDYILYLDADTLCCGKLSPIFKCLADGWDMVCTLSPPKRPLIVDAQRGKYTKENVYTDKKLGSNQWLQWAGGVWAFRRCAATEAFFKAFVTEWERYAWRDQQAMMRAFWKAPLRIHTLGTEWNLFVHVDDPKKSAGIMHFATAARAWGSKNHSGRREWRKWKAKL